MSITIRGVQKDSTINEYQAENQGGYYLTGSKQNLYEVQRSNNFEFIVNGISDLFENGMYQKQDNIFSTRTQEGYYSYAGDNPSDVLRISAIGFPVPTFSQNPIRVSRGNSTINYAGTATFDSGELSLNDFIGAGTVEVLQAWQNKSYNPYTDKVGVVGDYKRTCHLEEYTPDYQLVRRWILYGCWISRLRLGDMNNENGNKVSLSATITYDKALLDTSCGYQGRATVLEELVEG